jgi:2-dehydropantoate 2-reductase
MECPARILVLGAGAVGLPLAAKLSRVADVTAVTREPSASLISRDGLFISGAWGEETVKFQCVSEVKDGSDFDYILITSKSQDTLEICRQHKELIRDHETVSFQNGIGNEETISEFTDNVIGGVVMTGFVRAGNREVLVTANAGPMQIGRFPKGCDAEVLHLGGIMSRAGIPVETTDNIRGKLWAKNLINCSLNPLSAITGVTYGELRNPASWFIIDQMVREIYAVVRSEGVSLPWGDADAYLGYLNGALIPVMAGHRSSMLQDILHGRKTEIDFLNGSVVTAGRRQGIPTPYNACISEIIRFRESVTACPG